MNNMYVYTNKFTLLMLVNFLYFESPKKLGVMIDDRYGNAHAHGFAGGVTGCEHQDPDPDLVHLDLDPKSL